MKDERGRKWLLTLLALIFALIAQGGVLAETPPAQLVPAQVDRLDAEKEMLGGTYPGLMVTPRGSQADTDSKYNQPFHAVCAAYIARRASDNGDITGYARRFVVHAPDAESLPLAKRVARLLLLLCGMNRERLRHDHPVSEATVEVWLTRQNRPGTAGDIGGEQVNNQIYLYNIFAERKPVEWAREVAHEYGHFALPGVSGYTAPEEWANGVLGERLFLKWLHDDLRAGRLRPDALPFVTPEQLDEYLARQVTPLVRRIAHDGVEARMFQKKDAAGMDYYTGFALYLDTVYGSKGLLDALALTSPRAGGIFVQAPDFLQGALDSLRSATEFVLTPPTLAKEGKSDSFFIFLPRGEWSVTLESPVRSWQFPAEAKGVHPQGKQSVTVNIAGWQKLTISLSQATDAPVHLTFRRRDVEVQ